MGHGNISRQSLQPTSTNVQTQTNSQNDVNSSLESGTLAGREVVVKKIREQIKHVDNLITKQKKSKNKRHFLKEPLQSEIAKSEIDQLKKLVNRAVKPLDGTNDDLKAAIRHTKNNFIRSKDATCLRKFLLRAEEYMESYDNQPIPKQELPNILNKIETKIEKLYKFCRDPGKEEDSTMLP